MKKGDWNCSGLVHLYLASKFSPLRLSFCVCSLISCSSCLLIVPLLCVCLGVDS